MPDNIRFDIDRDVRIGLPEAVFCEGKSHDLFYILNGLCQFATGVLVHIWLFHI